AERVERQEEVGDETDVERRQPDEPRHRSELDLLLEAHAGERFLDRSEESRRHALGEPFRDPLLAARIDARVEVAERALEKHSESVSFVEGSREEAGIIRGDRAVLRLEDGMRSVMDDDRARIAVGRRDREDADL